MLFVSGDTLFQVLEQGWKKTVSVSIVLDRARVEGIRVAGRLCDEAGGGGEGRLVVSCMSWSLAH